MADNKSDPFKTPGWHSPVLHPAAEGDAFDAPPPMVPGGPVPDPIGNMSDKAPHKPGELPTK
jgi:hypothetical protein